MIPAWLPSAIQVTLARQDFDRRAVAALHELGDPIYALGGSWLASAELGGFGGQPGDRVTLRHRDGTRQIEVTTARRPLGGTRHLLHQLFVAVAHADLALPLDLRVDERHVMLPVGDGRQQFRVIEASTGYWVSAGGYEKRHLALAGTPGTAIDALTLVPVTLDVLGP